MSTCPADTGRVRSVIVERPEIGDAFVMRLDHDHDILMAVITLHEYYSVTDLREFLFDRLGAAGVPGTIVIVPAVSYAAVGTMTEESAARLATSEEALICNLVYPAGRTEQLLTGWWRQVLDRRVIGTEDDFLELGGNSLSAMLLLNIIEEDLRVTLHVDRFLQARTIRAIAILIDGYH